MPRRSKADDLSRRFGSVVRERRVALGETLEQVAARIERVDAKYLGEIERGWHSPTLPTIVKIARALGVSASELLANLDR